MQLIFAGRFVFILKFTGLVYSNNLGFFLVESLGLSLHSIMLLLLFSHVRLLCDTMDCSPPGSFVHEISQERILKWVAISFSRGSSWPRNQTICKQIILLVPFLFGCFLFLYLVWYLWLALPVVSWIDMVRVGILALYQKLDERLSVLPRWLRC